MLNAEAFSLNSHLMNGKLGGLKLENGTSVDARLDVFKCAVLMMWGHTTLPTCIATPLRQIAAYPMLALLAQRNGLQGLGLL
jgi:hypothetical protein